MRHCRLSPLIALTLAGTAACRDETTTGVCISLDTTISADICETIPESACTGTNRDWMEGTCEENGLPVSCGNNAFVAEGVDCPAVSGDQATACVYRNESFGDELCLAQEAEACGRMGGDTRAGACDALGFPTACGDLHVAAGISCPTAAAGTCIADDLDTGQKLCWASDQSTCVAYSAASAHVTASCTSAGYGVQCDGDIWLRDGATCP